MNNDINFAGLIASKIFRQLRSLDLIDELELRNVQIRNDYKALRVSLSAPLCVQILMDKYSLSDSAINSILFRKKSNKYKAPDI